MARHKVKKAIRFWQSLEGTLIDKRAKKRIGRLERAYNRLRARNRKSG